MYPCFQANALEMLQVQFRLAIMDSGYNLMAISLHEIFSEVSYQAP